MNPSKTVKTSNTTSPRLHAAGASPKASRRTQQTQPNDQTTRREASNFIDDAPVYPKFQLSYDELQKVLSDLRYLLLMVSILGVAGWVLFFWKCYQPFK